MINEYLLSIDFEYGEYYTIIDRIRKIYFQNPPPMQFLSSPKLEEFCIKKKTKVLKAISSPPKALHSFHFILPFFSNLLILSPSKLLNTAKEFRRGRGKH